MDKAKTEIISFKVDPKLREAIKGIDNRSEFIRNAILMALENTCPVCQGTGMLTPDAKKHWDGFMESHQMMECEDCHENYLICER
jgi:metal-responsive CopG/Arc/MetJ family transcriptional regulator